MVVYEPALKGKYSRNLSLQNDKTETNHNHSCEQGDGILGIKTETLFKISFSFSSNSGVPVLVFRVRNNMP